MKVGRGRASYVLMAADRVRGYFSSHRRLLQRHARALGRAA